MPIVSIILIFNLLQAQVRKKDAKIAELEKDNHDQQLELDELRFTQESCTTEVMVSSKYNITFDVLSFRAD